MECPPGRRGGTGGPARRSCRGAAPLALLALWPAACSALLVGQHHLSPGDGADDPASALPPTQCLREGENALPKELEVFCLPERRRITAAALRQIFERKFASKVKQAFADAVQGPTSSAIMVVQATSTGTRAGRFLRNFIVHAQRASKKDNSSLTVVSVALDNTSMTDCETAQGKYTKDLFRVTCVNVSGWLPRVFFSGPAEHQRRVDGSVGCGSCVYNMILWTKPTLLQAATSEMSEEQGVLMLDLDIVLYHNPLDHIRRTFPSRSTSTLLTARERTGKANTGAVFATGKSEVILDRWTKHADYFLQADTGDQAALQDLLLRLEMRSKWEKIPLNIIGQYGGKGEIGTHYNGYAGNKAAGMYKSGDWKPNEAAMYAAGDWVEDEVEE